VRASAGITTHPVPDAGIKSVIKDINLKIRWDLDQVAEVLGKKYGKDAVPVIRKQLQEQSNINAPLSLIVLENEFAICGFPGEFFMEYQIDLRNRFTGLQVYRSFLPAVQMLTAVTSPPSEQPWKAAMEQMPQQRSRLEPASG
jgi:hypothetical protein